MNTLGKLILKTLSVSLLSVSLLACSAVQHHKTTAYHTKTQPFATLPDGLAFPEGIAANPSTGDIYVSTFSFAGSNTVLRYDKTGKLLAQIDFAKTPLLGLAFNSADQMVYICNTGDDRILSLDMATGELSVFAESINGADGLAMDAHGYLWVVANQADKIVMLEPTGKVHGKLGMPGRVNKDGSHSGLLFPASLVIAGDTIYVTNLALPLTPAQADEVEEAVGKYTVSAIKIPMHK